MKKRIKTLLVLSTVILSIGLIPERQFNKAANQTIAQIAEEANIPQFAAKFVINTKIGRKIAFLFIKKKVKNASKVKDKK